MPWFRAEVSTSGYETYQLEAEDLDKARELFDSGAGILIDSQIKYAELQDIWEEEE